MKRSLLRSFSMTAVATAMLLSAAAPALAQENPPPTAGSVPPPMQAMAAPKGAEDMTGSIGFGVGVLTRAATTTLVTSDSTVALKYWLSDVLAVSPSLAFSVVKPTPPMGMSPATDIQWTFNPQAVVLFVPFRSTTTRFEVGAGLGINLNKNPTVSPDTNVGIFIPIQAGVEHFFARWFSLGIAASTRFFDYEKNNSVTILNINTAAYLGQLFFYTD
jgi:hypothetical protein